MVVLQVMVTDGWQQMLAEHSHLVGEAYKSLASQQILPVGPPRWHFIDTYFDLSYLAEIVNHLQLKSLVESITGHPQGLDSDPVFS